jgi:hypothetical protein
VFSLFLHFTHSNANSFADDYAYVYGEIVVEVNHKLQAEEGDYDCFGD